MNIGIGRVLRVFLASSVWFWGGSRVEASGFYSVTDLSTGGGGRLGFNPTLNNQGQVAGNWIDTDPRTQIQGEYPFLYDSQAGGKVTLPGITSPSGTSPGSFDFQGTLTGVSGDGPAIGQYYSNTRLAGSLPTGTYFVYQNGRETPLTGVGLPVAVNDAGDVVGLTPTTTYPQMGNLTNTLLLSHGTVREIGPAPGSDDAEAAAINGKGQIAFNTTNAVTFPGSNSPYGNGLWPVQGHAFLLDGQKWTDLGTLGGAASHALAMNANGDIAGWSTINANGDTHAMLVQFGKMMQDLGTLPGDKTSLAYGMNNLGQAVGLSFGLNSTTAYRGFLYQNGAMTDLNSLLPPGSGWSIKWGLAINDLGQILALADSADGGGDGMTVLLSPPGVSAPSPVYPEIPVTTPEPSTLALFGLLAAGLARRWRRKSGSSPGSTR